ncbi:pimeloyl-ACP methyl ester carboxylesterase [Mycolicibacterium iranicum]|uniref:Pimeloyl-ACP methyl ester carboxylesterase n=1 Tax=Mycolicibacterium iranicum TaxID=912594 RepID=A0A839PX39_MYCIR|nr:alpha/beta hydrolase [Mycolicibacterium iranicum]MBB2988640.1 pimeloyl-ACP methyl ester carboxylesterase [Mycolicibacterium iranicum]
MPFTGILAKVVAGATLATLAAGCGGAAADPQSPSAPRDTAGLPTVVLVHGAFADSSSWNGVVAGLQRDGYPVLAVANPLRGLHSDAEYVGSVLDSVSGPVVLAGHSYGGSVMSQAAVGRPNVKALVFIASFLLEPGESTSQLAAKFPGAQLGPALEPAPFPLPGGGTGNDLYIKQAEFRRVFAADVAPETTALMAATQRPIAESALNEPATAAAWKTIPSWNLVTTQDLAIPAESMRFMSTRAHSHTVEVDASHAVTVSAPGAVADLIAEAARATAA